jgi:class 3 adenylate cyclase/tetratricopeptide (TPR) repeat protein
MQCPRCQHENPTGMKFCGECAAPLVATCPSCGAANPPGNKFCGQCATPLQNAPKANFAAPHSYTPMHLAEKILTSKAALEGERKQVTVLFADLKGSMELLADRDPEEARRLLDPVLEHMMEAVHRYEGTVNQVMGDGIMALFGAPLAHEDHAVRACYAALRMQESARRYAEGVFRTYGVPVRIRVGLNSGEVVVRSIGSDLHMDYTAVGQTTHLAARMEQMANAGTILLTPDTLHLAEGFVQVQSLGLVAVKGLVAPTEIFELTGSSSARSRLQAAAARGLTTFVGRDAEMGTVFTALEQATAGKGQIVAVVGEPGVGKSRLFWEFMHSHRTHGCLVLEAASVSYGKATTYLPVIDLLKRYFQIEPRDDLRKIREKVTGKLFSLDRTLETWLAPLLWVLDVTTEDPDWERLDPPLRRQRLLEGIRRLALRESQVQPLVLVFEDLHWIDGETQALLDHLVESLPTARLLLLVNYRPEYGHSWGSKTYYRQLRIDPLSSASAEQLLEALLGNDPSLAALRPVLIARTEGNPFFLEESVQNMVETGVLAGERGAYRLVKGVEALQIPATAQTILAARIDRLPPEDKQLLQTASVIGKDIPYSLLRAVAEMDETALQARLASLQAAEFLYEVQLFPEAEFTFKHALTHEVAYGTLLGERRRALHGRLVEIIERFHADRLDEHVDRLVHHAQRGEVWDKALPYLRQAGTKATARLAMREATAYFEQALGVTDRLPRTRDVLEHSIDIRAALRSPLFALKDVDRLQAHLATAAGLATEIGDNARLAQILAFQAHYHWTISEPIAAMSCAREAIARAELAHAPNLRATGTYFLGQAQHLRGDYLEAIATLKANIDCLQGNLRAERGGLALPVSLVSRVWLSFALASVGRFDASLEEAGQAVAQAELLREAYSLFHAYWALGASQLTKGEHKHAAATFSRALDVARSVELPRLVDAGAALLGHTYALIGRPTDALLLLEETVERKSGRHSRWQHARDVYFLADAYLRSGRVDAALRAAEQALDLSRTYGQRGQEADVLCILADIHTIQGHNDLSEQYDSDALTLATELGMRPLIAHCHLGLGKLYRLTGSREQAREHLTNATTMYREMGMTYWLEQAEAGIRELT